jgi:hypothetical protein
MALDLNNAVAALKAERSGRRTTTLELLARELMVPNGREARYRPLGAMRESR